MPCTPARAIRLLLAVSALAIPSLPLCAQRAAASDSLMMPGVSANLARYRRTRVRDVHYALDLDVRARDRAQGTALVRFTRLGTGDAILDFRGLALSKVLVNGIPLDASAPGVWNHAHLRVPARSLRAGSNSISASFVTPIAPAGASIIRAHDATDGSDYLYTLLVPSDANLLFPCFDQPDLKARITLSITTPVSWRALGNGAQIARDSSTTGMVHKFAETQPLSTYLVAFAAGPWSVTSRNVVISAGLPARAVELWTRGSRANEAESDTLIEMNARALRWLGEWFDRPYAFGKYAALLAPAFPFGGMEHPGAVFYNEESFIYRERPTVTQLLGRQATVYHEVAHQWFGDYVTMQWFDDLWLKEGFATYMAAKMQASLDPSANAWKTFYLRNKPVAYATDASAGTVPVWQALANLDQAKSNYGPIVYNKAPGVLRQLEYTVGERAFQRGIRAFLRAHPYGNATWRDLLGSVGTAAGTDLTAWGASWILRPGMPVIEQRLRVANGRIVNLQLTQRAAQPRVSQRGAWPISTEVLLYYTDRPSVRIPVRFRGDSITVVQATGLPAPAFVFANSSDYAYALVLPDSSSLSWLEQNVETVKDDFLRAMLYGAMWDLVREARLSPARYAAAALRALPREPDEQLASSLTGRITTSLLRYLPRSEREALLPVAEQAFLSGASDTTRSYGVRKSQLDASIAIAASPPSLRRLSAWLQADSVLGLALRPPTRWAIVAQLIARGAPEAEARLADETQRDSTTEGRRQAFVAGAGRRDAAIKAEYFRRWFGDKELNEEWATSSLRAFHDPDQSALTLPYLVPALDTLPWIQSKRRIFFLGAWLGATIGGQSDAGALAAIDGWLTLHPALPADLRQKILQARDELERTVAIRRTFIQ